MRTFRARFPGRCAADCGEPIEPDQEVGYIGDELVHAGCEDAALSDAEEHGTPCTSCWMVHAGECL